MWNNFKTHYIKNTIQGVFYLIPILIITAIIFWVYGKIDAINEHLFSFLKLDPEGLMRFILNIIILIVASIISYIIGHFVNTKIGDYIYYHLQKIPGFSTIKNLVNIVNSSKKEKNVLVVAIKGLVNDAYSVGLMYAIKPSVIKDHYTVTISQSPMPNGGNVFEVHKDKILVIEEATFNDNLEYLLSMGTKSLAEIVNIKPKSEKDFITLTDFLNNKEEG